MNIQKIHSKIDFHKIDPAEINVGDIFMSGGSYGNMIRIYEITDNDEVLFGEIVYSTDPQRSTYIKGPLDGTWWTDHYGSLPSKASFIEKYGAGKIAEADIKQLFENAKAVMSGETSIEQFKPDETQSNNTDIMMVNSKEFLEAKAKQLLVIERTAYLMHAAINHIANRERSRLSSIMSMFALIKTEMAEQIKRIERVIFTIEVYMGMKSEVVQIQEGPVADTDILTMRNRVMYMDEEVGEPGDDMRGIDFNDIREFDQWLTEYSDYYCKTNYELICPEELSVVLIKPRRTDKRYSSNPWVNSMLNAENHRSYLLIRNGANLYRLWTDISLSKLFPNKAELTSLQADLLSEKPVSYRKSAEDKLFRYKQIFILLQGIVDRAELGLPRVKFMDIEQNNVNFIYDDGENLIGEGLESYSQWRKRLNADLEVGKRIYFNVQLAHDRYMSDETRSERYNETYQNGRLFQGKRYYNLPANPDSGVYTLHDYKTKDYRHKTIVVNNAEEMTDLQKAWYEKHNKNVPTKFPTTLYVIDEYGYRVMENYNIHDMCILYHPGHTDYYGNPTKNKRRVSFKIYETDSFILNYDNLHSTDFDQFLQDRRYRREYLSMLPMLLGVKKWLQAEEAKEEAFKQMLLLKVMSAQGLNQQEATEKLNAAIKWWKLKNKTKRPITKDENKVYRMIMKKLRIVDES